MRRAGWALIAAWVSCAGGVACSSFSGDEGATNDDAGADATNAPLVDAAPSDGAVRQPGPNELLFDSFEASGTACDGWVTNEAAATKKDVDGGRVCQVCAATAGLSSAYKNVPATKIGTYTLTGKVHNLTAANIDSRIVVYFANPDAGGPSDISTATSGPEKGMTAVMQASFKTKLALKSLSISYRLDNQKGGCIEIDDVLLEHIP